MSQDELNRLAFLEEAGDLLSEMESALLELESRPEDRDLVDRVFRAMHTIKGSGAMFGFDDISTFTHTLENLFDCVRNGILQLDRATLDLTLASRDHINYLLVCAKSDRPADMSKGEDLANRLKALTSAPPCKTKGEVEAGAEEEEEAAGIPHIYSIRFKPHEDFFYTGANPLSLLGELSRMGSFQVFGHFEDVPLLEDLDPERCHVWWDALLGSTASTRDIRNVFLFAEDDCDLQLRSIDRLGSDIGGQATHRRLGEILLERGDITEDDLRKVLEEKPRIGDILTQRGVVSEEKVVSALAEQRTVREFQERQTPVAHTREQVSSLRVAADKLDYLVNLVGELVIVQAQISQVVGTRHDPTLTALSEELERLSDELRDSTLGIRMLPIGTTFSKFRRLVRDLSADLGKEIELLTEGAETELDKTVIERLNDPLVHLLRNSIDHGIELPAERTVAGKPTRGTILLTAEHSGGEVLIRIKDDGKGIDVDAVRTKAVERGLILPEADLPEKEILNCIFLPGFSTAKRVTNVSGRGVGMDVVRRGIEELRGSIDLDSQAGRGTVITVRLPLTLAIIEGLQVMVEDEYYVIPLSLVEECVELIVGEQDETREQILNLRGEIVPYVRLREWFEVTGQRPRIEQIVVVGVQGVRVGIVVDHVIGEHQTVIKSLGRVYKNVEGISGATIKGDGSMALILDVPRLIQNAAESWSQR